MTVPPEPDRMGLHKIDWNIRPNFATDLVDVVWFTDEGPLLTVNMEPEHATLMGDALQRFGMEIAQHIAARGPDPR